MADDRQPNKFVPVPMDSDRPPVLRLGDQLALDFLNTTASPRGSVVEWLTNGSDFLAWLVTVDVIDAETAREIAARISRKALDDVAKEAIGLREWLRGLIVRSKAAGRPVVGPAELDRLNQLLSQDAPLRRLARSKADGHLHLIEERRWQHPGELLAPIAMAAAELLCDGDFDLIRRCEDPSCSLWFYDRTKGHRRRWCSQAACGNRAKAAAHRQRLRLER